MLAGRVALVQRGLQDEDRPVGVARRDAAEDVQHVLLGVVHRLDHDDDQIGLGFQLGDLRRTVVARFAQAAGIEKAEKAFVLIGEGVHLGRAGARPEAAADFGAAAARHGVNERCLSRLGLAQEPDDRRRQGRFRRAQAIVQRARIDFGRKHFPPDLVPQRLDACHRPRPRSWPVLRNSCDSRSLL